MAEVQKQEAVASTKVDIEKAKQEMEMQKMQVAAQIKQAEMERQFQYDMQLKQMDIQVERNKEQFIEDRKDKRTKIQATQQSEMISQRKNDGLPIDFENQPDQGLGAFM
jgi:predicted Holliday junction resolvase-like endonuclease